MGRVSGPIGIPALQDREEVNAREMEEEKREFRKKAR
jgi:hypothetical protein